MRVLKAFLLTMIIGAAVCSAADIPNAVSPFDADKAKEYQEATAQALGVPVTKTVELGDDVKMEFVLIPAGEYHMGSSTVEARRDRNEGPAHPVKLTKPFYMGKFEVTQKQYKTVFAGTVFAQVEFKFEGENAPAEMVSWYEVDKFLQELSKAKGMKFRLPTEAEWEFACRAGTTTPFHFGSTILPEQANYQGSASPYPGSHKGMYMKRTVDVGLYPANAFGLHDMHGNIWEWCSDWWNSSYYRESVSTDPKGPPSGKERVIRGGCWKSDPEKVRSANRDAGKPSKHEDLVGFRVVLDIEPAKAE